MIHATQSHLIENIKPIVPKNNVVLMAYMLQGLYFVLAMRTFPSTMRLIFNETLSDSLVHDVERFSVSSHNLSNFKLL